MCDGKRLKKRKTSTKRNTLNPVYNEAIVFDVPPENIDQISLLIAVMDYDRSVPCQSVFPFYFNLFQKVHQRCVIIAFLAEMPF